MTALLPGCGVTTPKPVAVVGPSINPCSTIVLVPYTDAQQDKLLAEETATPGPAEWKAWVKDYIGERDQIRACQRALR
jgi:hypothetical protein